MSDQEGRASVHGTLVGMMVDKGVPLDVATRRAEQKIARTRTWWRRAGVFLTVAFAFSATGTYVLLQKDASLLLAIALGVPVALALLAAVFCASQADTEATNKFLDKVLAALGRKSA